MNAPMIWILLPALAGIILLITRHWYRVTVISGTFLSLALAALARLIPIGSTVDIGAFSFKLESTLIVLGRRFVLVDNDRPLLVITFVLAAFWFGAASLAKAGRVTVPLGLVVIALLTAALAVEPFLFAAILVEITVLICIPILVQYEVDPSMPRHIPVRGSLRFLTFQTLGMLFLLLTGWLLTGVETTPGSSIALQAATLLGFGFALLMAVFPFHTWVLMLAQDAHPYVAAFVFLLFTWMVSLYGLRFFDRYLWLRENTMILTFIRIAGVIMVLAGGWNAFFEEHLGRVLGCAVLFDTGFNLLALTLPSGPSLLFATLMPRALTLGIWALALSVLQVKATGLKFSQVKGFSRSLPLTTASLVIAQFTISGMPIFAYFPVRLEFFELMSADSLWVVWLCLAGAAGLFASAARVMYILTSSKNDASLAFQEDPRIFTLVGIALAANIVFGLFPQWFLPVMVQGLQAFEHLGP